MMRERMIDLAIVRAAITCEQVQDLLRQAPEGLPYFAKQEFLYEKIALDHIKKEWQKIYWENISAMMAAET